MPDDDPKAIPNETRLFRRINPVYTVYDSNRKERRPTSRNFQDSNDGSPMSVFAENIAIAHGEVPAGFLRGPLGRMVPRCGSCRMDAREWPESLSGPT